MVRGSSRASAGCSIASDAIFRSFICLLSTAYA
jgi:hypothetical protein